MAQPRQVPPQATIADFDRFMERREDDFFELVDGTIVAMSNSTESHEQIVLSIAAAIRPVGDRRGCRTYAGGVRVQRSEEVNDSNKLRPDVVVKCSPRTNRTFITDPVIVVEVLSPSTLDRDRGPKLTFYKTLPSLQHIALVYQDQMRIEHYRRTDDGWTLEILTMGEQHLQFDAIEFEIALNDVYYDIDFGSVEISRIE